MPIALNAQGAPRAERRPMPVTTPDSNSSMWVAVYTIGAAFAGAVLKTFVDLVGRRDNFTENFRRDTLAELKALREQNTHQQEQINAAFTRTVALEQAVHTEKDLRHEIRERLNAKTLEVEVMKHDYATLQVEFAKTRALYESACAAAGSKPEPMKVILAKHQESAIPKAEDHNP